MTDTLGERIRQAREIYGMTQAELARRIKVSKQALYQIESNKTPDPGVLKVKAIADILKVSVDALLGREVNVSTPQTTPWSDAPSAQSKPPAKRTRTRTAASGD